MEFREAILAIRPDVDVELIGRAYDIAAGRPLADLPAEAMEMRSSRSRSAAP